MGRRRRRNAAADKSKKKVDIKGRRTPPCKKRGARSGSPAEAKKLWMRSCCVSPSALSVGRRTTEGAGVAAGDSVLAGRAGGLSSGRSIFRAGRGGGAAPAASAVGSGAAGRPADELPRGGSAGGASLLACGAGGLLRKCGAHGYGGRERAEGQ